MCWSIDLWFCTRVFIVSDLTVAEGHTNILKLKDKSGHLQSAGDKPVFNKSRRESEHSQNSWIAIAWAKLALDSRGNYNNKPHNEPLSDYRPCISNEKHGTRHVTRNRASADQVTVLSFCLLPPHVDTYTQSLLLECGIHLLPSCLSIYILLRN